MEETPKKTPKHAAPGTDVSSSNEEGQKKRFSNWKRWQKVLAIVGVCLAALIVICILTVVIMLNVGKSELLSTPGDDQSYQTIEYEGKTYVYNQDVASICVIGSDRLYGDGAAPDRSGQADAILLLTYDTSSGKAHLVNVPRNLILDFTIDVPNVGPRNYHSYLAVAYGLYAKSDAQGSMQLCEAITGLLGGIPVKNYFMLLESAIAPLTEAMGGVEITAIEDVPWVQVEKGKTYRMQGEQALRYVQWRDIHVLTSPTDRMYRQRQFADAFLKQSVEAIKKDPSVLLDFYSILTDPDYMTTNIDLPELAYLVSVALDHGVDELIFSQIPYDDVYNEDTLMSEYYARQDELTQLILDIYYKPAE